MELFLAVLMANLRPGTTSSWQEESRFTWYIFVGFILTSLFKIIFRMMSEKIIPRRFYLTRLILLFRGRRSFLGASICTEIDFLVSRGSQAGVCMLDNVVPARTSDSLVRIH